MMWKLTILINVMVTLSFNGDYDSSCPCDLIDQLCDEYCCCDLKCSQYSNFWNTVRKCSDKVYPNLYLIPDCQDSAQPSIDDLYVGFRVAYNIIKNLGCVITKQVDMTYLFSKLPQGNYLSSALENIKDPIVTTTITQDTPTLPIFLRQKESFGSKCYQQVAQLWKIYQPLECHEQYGSFQELTDAAPSLYSILSYLQPFVYENQTIPMKHSIRFIDQDYRLISQTAPSVPDAACTTLNGVCSCTNLVYEVDYVVGLNSLNNIDQITVNFIVQPISSAFDCNSNNIQVPVTQSLTYKRNGSTIFEYSANPGYDIGSPVQVSIGSIRNAIDSVTQKQMEIMQYSLLNQPLRIGIHSPNGQCVINNLGLNLQKPFTIELGRNAQYSCLDLNSSIETTNYCNTTLYQNLLDRIQYLGIYGNSNPENINDWIQVEKKIYSTTALSPYCPDNSLMFLQLRIYYSAYGQKTKERFKINRALFEFVEQNTFQQNRRLNFFIQYTKIDNDYVHFKAPSPNIVPYLPNDVMYPFFIATNSLLLAVSFILIIL